MAARMMSPRGAPEGRSVQGVRHSGLALLAGDPRAHRLSVEVARLGLGTPRHG